MALDSPAQFMHHSRRQFLPFDSPLPRRSLRDLCRPEVRENGAFPTIEHPNLLHSQITPSDPLSKLQALILIFANLRSHPRRLNYPYSLRLLKRIPDGVPADLKLLWSLSRRDSGCQLPLARGAKRLLGMAGALGGSQASDYEEQEHDASDLDSGLL
ncbi:hypothetical protein C8F01DRAFT_376909 [Mycena amicta]|nr:hypothetical protein C8F01DRAFT_376909 [Mycena amicta]